MDRDLVPFGVIDNGIDDPFDDIERDGDLWTRARSGYTLDNVEWDTLRNKHRL
jgi:hypothetical protein